MPYLLHDNTISHFEAVFQSLLEAHKNRCLEYAISEEGNIRRMHLKKLLEADNEVFDNTATERTEKAEKARAKDSKKTNNEGYSWIANQLHIGRTPAFLLSKSDFKSLTSFGFLIENYTGHVFWIFCGTAKQARLASSCVYFFSVFVRSIEG